MNRQIFSFVGASALLVASWGCANSNTLSPAPGAQSFAGSLKATAPVPVSPINGQPLASNTFTATAAIPQFSPIALQYRFQVFSAAGSQVLDSGPVNSPVWKTFNLTPNQQLTWKVRAEFEGTPGPWFTTASFQSGDPAPSFPGPIGDWQHCAGLVGAALSNCVNNAIHPKNSVGAFEVTKRIAWLVRGDGGGLLIKTGGENVVLWQGYSFSASRMCFTNGQIFKVITDAGPGGKNGPDFSDNGVIDPASCVPAIDPSKP